MRKPKLHTCDIFLFTKIGPHKFVSNLEVGLFGEGEVLGGISSLNQRSYVKV